MEKLKNVKVIFFDVIETLLDIEDVKISLAKILDNRPDLADLWFNNMHLYTLVDSVTGKYHDFGIIGYATFSMIAHSYNIDFPKEEVINQLKKLNEAPPHPDVAESLEYLKNIGFNLAAFSNSSNAAVKRQLESSKLNKFIDRSISVEDIGYYKPHIHTYHSACRMMNVLPSECLLVASQGWDIAGAVAAGMKTVFIKRKGAVCYPLTSKPDYIVNNLKDFVRLLEEHKRDSSLYDTSGFLKKPFSNI